MFENISKNNLIIGAIVVIALIGVLIHFYVKKVVRDELINLKRKRSRIQDDEEDDESAMIQQQRAQQLQAQQRAQQMAYHRAQMAAQQAAQQEIEEDNELEIDEGSFIDPTIKD